MKKIKIQSTVTPTEQPENFNDWMIHIQTTLETIKKLYL